ncbi:MAG: DCC1-like thiol-disulfide oxidoreductase family protein [Desulforhopalus sp.]
MEKTEQPLIIFDGVCNLCEYSVKFIIKNDRHARFKFVSAQSVRGKDVQRLHRFDTFKDGTVILLKKDQVYVKSDAAVEIAKDLDGLWRFLHVLKFIPKPVRNLVYSIISKNRYRWFGKKNECLLPDKNIKDRFL